MKTGRKNVHIGRIVGKRVLTDLGNSADGKVSGQRVVLKLGIPRRDRTSLGRETWLCPFLIEGLDRTEIQWATGSDSLQALLVAITGLRAYVERSFPKLLWIDSKIGAGLPIFVPTAWGRVVEDRIRLAIERETVRGWRAEIKRHRRGMESKKVRLRRQGLSAAEIKRALAEKEEAIRECEAEIDNLKPGWNRPESGR
jgi:hypothetical protein